MAAKIVINNLYLFKIINFVVYLQLFLKKNLHVMKILEAKFAGTSTKVEQKPKEILPEFAFIGRSNVGKSSLINTLCASGRLALTSSKPGKTRLVNHFRINGEWYLVDLPGYGFAKCSQNERHKIEEVIRNYLNFSSELKHLFILIDSRHDLTGADASFLREMGGSDIPFSIIFTKADKQGPNVLRAQVEKNKLQILEFWEELPPVFISSSETGAGREEILDYIGTVLDNLNSQETKQ